MALKKTSKRRREKKEKRETHQRSSDQKKTDDCHEEQGCQCYLQRGIFLPPGVDEDETNNGPDTKQKN
jgi:hypothetical protein